MSPEEVEKIADHIENVAQQIPEEQYPAASEKIAADAENLLDSTQVLNFLKFFGGK